MNRESITRGSVLSLLSGWVLLPAGIATNVVIARVLGPELKGVLTIFLVTQGILALPGIAIQAGIIHFIATRRPDWTRFRRFGDLLAVLQSVVSVGLVAILFRVPPIRTVLYGGLEDGFLWAAMAALAASLVYFYRSAVLQGVGLPGKGAVWGASTGLLMNGIQLAPLMWWWWTGASPGVGPVIISSVVATVVTSIVWIPLTSNVTVEGAVPFRRREAAASIGAFAAPTLGRNVVEWVNLRADAYFIQALAGPGQLGLYTVAVGLGQQLWQVPFAISGPLFSRVAIAGDSHGTRAVTQMAFRVMGLISLALAVALVAVAHVLLPLVYGDRFAGSVPLLMLLLPGIAAIGPTRVLTSYLSGVGRPGETLRAQAAGALVTVSLLAVLVPRLGAAGASVASSAAYLTYASILCLRFVQLTNGRWQDLLTFRRNDWVRIRARLISTPSIQRIARRSYPGVVAAQPSGRVAD